MDDSISVKDLLDRLERLGSKSAIDPQMTFEIELLVHGALSSSLRKIAQEVHYCLGRQPAAPGGRRKTVLFLDTRAAAAIESAEFFDAQMTSLIAAFQLAGEIADPPSGPGIATVAAAPAAAAAVSLLSVLREDVVYSGRSVKIDESSVAAELGRYLKDRYNYLWPSLFLTDLCKPSTSLNEVALRLNAVMGARLQAEEAVSRLSVKFRNLKDGDPSIPQTRATLDRAQAQFDAADSIFRQFSIGSVEANPKTGLTAIGAVQLGFKIREFLKESDTYLVWVRVAASGGSYRVSSGLLPVLLGRDLKYSGGVVLAYALLDRCGKLICSGLEREFRPFCTSSWLLS